MGLDQPSWQGIGAIISLVGIIITLIVFWLQLPKRKLLYSISTPRPLLQESNVAIHKLQIVRNGAVIPNPTVVTVRFRNAGRGEIEKSDFSEPIRIDFGPTSVLHSAVHYRSHPPDMPVELTQEVSAFSVDPLLLNRKDSFEVQCLVTSPTDDPKVTGRIKGVSRLVRSSEEEFYSGRLRIFAQGYSGHVATVMVIAFIVFSALDSVLLASKLAAPVLQLLIK